MITTSLWYRVFVDGLDQDGDPAAAFFWVEAHSVKHARAEARLVALDCGWKRTYAGSAQLASEVD